VIIAAFGVSFVVEIKNNLATLKQDMYTTTLSYHYERMARQIKTDMNN